MVERVRKMSDVEDKWGADVAQRGFAQIPNYLLYLNQFLDQTHKLTPIELLILMQLTGSWWKKGDRPYPSMATLATRCGASTRQIQRALNRLQELGFIKKEARREAGIIASNAYDLEPLAKVLNRIAKHFPNSFPRRIEPAIAEAIGKELKSES